MSSSVLIPAPQLITITGRVLTTMILAVLVLLVVAETAFSARSQQAVTTIVLEIQKADYAGDRAALIQLHDQLQGVRTAEPIAPSIFYWQGFALWRRAINGFNESINPKELEGDLNSAIADFQKSLSADSGFLDAKVGIISCISSLVYLNEGNETRVKELILRSSPMIKELKERDPDNPRFLWVLGPILWNIPGELGGGQDKAMEAYQRGLNEIRKRSETHRDVLQPSWGEAELLMSLSWSNLHKSTPDIESAYRYAQDAMKLVPFWHYVRDILVPQIQRAKAS